MLSRLILDSVGTKTAKVTTALYDKMLEYECVRDMAYMGGHPTPNAVLTADGFDSCFARSESKEALKIDESWEGSAVGGDGTISGERVEGNRKAFLRLKKELIKLLKDNGLSIEAYLADSANMSSKSTIGMIKSDSDAGGSI